jgi:DNA-directed RNA polymerase specialized sigma24 family protein
MRAFKNLPQFRGESQMATWLGVIVLNAFQLPTIRGGFR